MKIPKDQLLKGWNLTHAITGNNEEHIKYKKHIRYLK